MHRGRAGYDRELDRIGAASMRARSGVVSAQGIARRIGIPYARQQLDPTTRAWFVVCPLCGVRIELLARKDFESFTHEEYRGHVAGEHPDA